MCSDANDHRQAICRWFYTELQRFHIRAGEPTYAEMEELSKRHRELRFLSHSTVQEVLTGKRRRLPDLGFLDSFVTVCRLHAEQIRSPHRLPTVADWRLLRYKASISALDTAQWPTFDEAGTGHSGAAGHSAVEQEARPGDMPADTVTDTATGRHLHAGEERASRATMLALAKHGQKTAWWLDHRDVVPEWFAAYLSLEPAAELIRCYETTVIPDLLQTQEYARCLIRAARNGTGRDIDRRLELLMRRQQILYRSNTATRLWAIIDEDVLHDPAIATATMRAQVEHLIQIGQRPNVALQVMLSGMSSTPAGHTTPGGPITILRFPERELPDVVYLAQPTGGLYPDSLTDISHYTKVMDRLGIEAKKGAETRNILNRLLTDL